MFKFTASILTLALAATQAAAQATVNSINPVQCQPVAITWSGATGPVFLSIVQGTDVSATPLRTFPQQSGASGSYTWSPVDVPAGTVITIVINDGSGQQNFSGQSTVAQGSNDCNPTLAAASESGGSSAAASTSSAAASSSASSSAPTPTGASSSSASKPSSSSKSSSAASSPAASNDNNGNGAADLKMNSGLSLAALAGVVGAGYALF